MPRNNTKKRKSELTVLTRVSELTTYIATVTIRSPAKYRQSYVLRLQNLSLDAMQLLYAANSYVLSTAEPAEGESRLGCQRRAYVTLKTLSKFLFAAYEVRCLTAKQYQYAAKLLSETQDLLAKWERSDFKRLGRPPLPFMLDDEIDEPRLTGPMQTENTAQQFSVQPQMQVPPQNMQYTQPQDNYVPPENYNYGQYPTQPFEPQYNQYPAEPYSNGNGQYDGCNNNWQYNNYTTTE